MENNINLNVPIVDENSHNATTDGTTHLVPPEPSVDNINNPIMSTFLNPINRPLRQTQNLRISDIINRSRDGRRSREVWRRSISSGNLMTDITEDPVDKFETNLGTFTSESDLFTTSAHGYNIYNRITSQIDMKLNDFFNKMNNDTLSSDFESSLKPHIKFDELTVDEECEAQITKELGISLTEFEIYVAKYKELINKYFNNVVDKEKKIKSTLRKLHNLNKWVKRVQSFSLMDEDDDDNNPEDSKMEDAPPTQSNTTSGGITHTPSTATHTPSTATHTPSTATHTPSTAAHTASTVELRLLSGIQDYVSEKVKDLDALKLRREHEVSRKCFTKLVNIGQKINNIHQNQLCTICLTNSVSICLIPCGHSCCEGCYNSYSDNSNSNRRRICFVCRGTVSKTQKIYFTS